MRNVWGEAAANNYVLMIKPAGWISLRDEGEIDTVDDNKGPIDVGSAS